MIASTILSAVAELVTLAAATREASGKYTASEKQTTVTTTK